MLVPNAPEGIVASLNSYRAARWSLVKPLCRQCSACCCRLTIHARSNINQYPAWPLAGFENFQNRLLVFWQNAFACLGMNRNDLNIIWPPERNHRLVNL